MIPPANYGIIEGLLIKDITTHQETLKELLEVVFNKGIKGDYIDGSTVANLSLTNALLENSTNMLIEIYKQK